LKNPLRDLPNEVFVVLGSSDEEPFDLVIRCVRAYFRALPPQLLVVSVVSHDHALLPSSRRTPLPLRWTFSILEVATAQPFKKTALPKVTGGKRSEITSRKMRPPGVRIVSATGVVELLRGSSNHAKAALLAVDGRLFQSFKGANPRIVLDFGLPVESSLSFFLVAGSEPLLRSEILDDHSQASPFGPKK
jgi:hypothetical protein